MTKSEIFSFLVLRSIGNFLILFAIFGVIATFGPSLYYEAQFRVAQARGISYKVVASLSELKDILAKSKNIKTGKNLPLPKDSQQLSEILTENNERILIPKDTDFSILIPKIGASSPIYSNIDPNNVKEFVPILEKGVAHAKGSVFPGMQGTIYLFAHSTDNFWNIGRYNAVFYLLKDLSFGDEIVLFFENRRYNYAVTDSKIIDPEDVTLLTDSQKIGTQSLILQTCWPPGTTWKRLIVLAKPK